MFHHPTRPSDFVRRALALTAILGASVAVATAQTSPAAASDTQAAPVLNLQVPAVDTSNDNLFSSSQTSAGTEVASNAGRLNLPDAMVQYGGGRRYGRPRYRGGNSNQDGSPKYAFIAGAGFTQPLGNTYHYNTPSYSFQVGGGRNFNKNVGLVVQFDWDNFGLNGRTIAQQTFLYDPNGTYGIAGYLDGHAHVWSFTLNPTFTLYSGEGLGAYAVMGVGFYHKVTNFTLPITAQGYDYYGYLVQYTQNQSIDEYTSNAPGFNGGFGLTYKPSRFSGERLYGEVRYVFVDNQQRQGFSYNNYRTANPNQANYYPANSNRTTYLPVKFGIRF